MTRERYIELMFSKENIPLTSDEIKETWHFCPDWDFLLKRKNPLEPCSCDIEYCNPEDGE